nr:hypothetical protein [Tanacetum cinerariifolium]
MDDEPMWDADRVVALTLGSAITIPETAYEFAIKAMMMEKKRLRTKNVVWLKHLTRAIIGHTLNANSGLSILDPLMKLIIEHCIGKHIHNNSNEMARKVPFERRDERPEQPRVVYVPILDINYFRHFLDILENYNPMDDEPMWVAYRVVAPNPCFAITIPETANELRLVVFFLYKTPNQAYQLLEDKVLLKLDWAKKKTKSSLKKTVAFSDEGLSNSNTNKIMARMDALTMKMDAQYKVIKSRSNHSIHEYDEDDKPMSPKAEAKFMQTFRHTQVYNGYRDSNRDN